MIYINDVHILMYVLVAFVAGIIGQVVDYLNVTFLNERKVLSKTSINEYKKICKINYKLIIINIILNMALLYKFKLSLDFVRFAILVPMLLSAFVVDYKIQIIPNRLNFTMFEIGVVFAFILGIQNLSIAADRFLGMIVGGGIFLLITIVGGLIAGKEAMGLGDVKLMGALGLYLGATNVALISVLSFLIGAIVSIVILIAKKNREDGYIPFGPFIVIAVIIGIFVPTNTMFTVLMKIFTLGMY